MLAIGVAGRVGAMVMAMPVEVGFRTMALDGLNQMYVYIDKPLLPRLCSPALVQAESASFARAVMKV